MTTPDGTLAPMQHEIMDVVWTRGDQGATTSEIWQQISEKRDVGRTTIVNQVDRLEKRGWLTRRKSRGGYRYTASMSRQDIEKRLASQFVDHFFSGCASRLVASLLGSKRVSEQDVQQIRQLLDQFPAGDSENEPSQGELD